MGENSTNNESDNFEHYNVENLATYVGALAVILPVLTVIVRIILRPRVVVNCWFCNTNSRVAHKQINSWFCHYCEQYNGFLPCGDYNKDIPEQRAVTASNQVSYVVKSKLSSESNGLCDRCNTNQEIKMMHLAAFEPNVPSNYDEELVIFRKQLEHAYRLCLKCESVVAATLERKKGLVLGLQLRQSENRTLGRLKFLKYTLHNSIRKVLLSTAVFLCLMSTITMPLVKSLNLPMLELVQRKVEADYWTILAASVFTHLLLTGCTGRKLPLLACLMHCSLYLWECKQEPHVDFSYALGTLNGLTLILTLLGSNKIRRGAFVKLQQMEEPTMGTKKPEKESKPTQLEGKPKVISKSTPLNSLEEQKDSSNKSKDSRTLFTTLPEATLKPTFADQPQQTTLSQCQDDNSSVDSAFSNHDSLTQDSDSVKDDVNSLIQSLNLGSQWRNSPVAEKPDRPRTPGSRHEFQSRSLRSGSVGRSDRPVLNPPRLITPPKNLNESSWVAGGFWQEQQNSSFGSISPSSVSQQGSRPGSPSSVYSQATSAWNCPSPRPGSPVPPHFVDPNRLSPQHYPVFSPTPSYGPPNGFHQPFGFQPFMYPTSMNPVWNSAMFQPLSPNPPASSVSCSSASTCNSVRHRRCNTDCNGSVLNGDFASVSSSFSAQKRFNLVETLWNNSSIILYTSMFYATITASIVLLYHKW